MSKRLSGERPGTVLLGSIGKRAYLFLCQTAERMGIERQNARQHGIQDPIDFVFEFDGRRHELSYEELRDRLQQPTHSPDWRAALSKEIEAQKVLLERMNDPGNGIMSDIRFERLELLEKLLEFEPKSLSAGEKP
jgi:hypothetical protein